MDVCGEETIIIPFADGKIEAQRGYVPTCLTTMLHRLCLDLWVVGLCVFECLCASWCVLCSWCHQVYEDQTYQRLA